MGLLVIGMEVSAGYTPGFVSVLQDGKPRLFNTSPTGLYDEYKAYAIGARSQAARTYLERTYEAYPDCNPHLSLNFIACATVLASWLPSVCMSDLCGSLQAQWMS